MYVQSNQSEDNHQNRYRYTISPGSEAVERQRASAYSQAKHCVNNHLVGEFQVASSGGCVSQLKPVESR